MAEDLSATVRWTSKMHFEGKAAFEHSVPLDFSEPLGEGRGIRPMELLLMSLAACSGQTVISLLQKMRQDIRSFSVEASGSRRSEHPRTFTEIRLDYVVSGVGIDRDAIENAVRYSEGKYCPVWAMLKPSARLSSSFRIE